MSFDTTYWLSKAYIRPENIIVCISKNLNTTQTRRMPLQNTYSIYDGYKSNIIIK